MVFPIFFRLVLRRKPSSLWLFQNLDLPPFGEGSHQDVHLVSQPPSTVNSSGVSVSLILAERAGYEIRTSGGGVGPGA